MRKRRARIDRDDNVRCRKCGSQNLLVRSGELNGRLRRLKCGDCDERQWLRTRDLHKVLGEEKPDPGPQLVFDGFEQAGVSRHRLPAPRRIA